MNGRIYDPTLGRFLQADPHIQAPGNSQSYNRYSYVLNNPLSYTDPSGYFFKWAAKKLLGKAGAQIAGFGIGGLAGAAFGAWAYDRTMNSQGLQTIASVALNFIPGCQVWCSAVFSAQVNYYHTGSLSAAFHAGGRTAAIAGVFYGIGSAFNGEAGSGFFAKNGAGHIFTHAVAGGVISDLQGGKFGHGFFAAGITKGFQASGMVSNNAVVGTVQSMVVGGTASAISGGKFANGATTAAFQYLYNHARMEFRHPDAQLNDWLNSIADDAKSLWNAMTDAVSTTPAAGANAAISANVLVAGGSFEKGVMRDTEGNYCQAQVMCGRVGPGIGSSISVVPSIATGLPLKNGGSWQYGIWLDGPAAEFNFLTDFNSSGIGRPVISLYDTSIGAGVQACYVELSGCSGG